MYAPGEKVLKLFRESGVLIGIMKKILFALFALASVVLFASDSKQEIAKKLYGRIKIVDGGEDYKVRLVDGAEDMKVKLSIFDNTPGVWHLVGGAEDYKVRLVDGAEDIRVKITNFYEWDEYYPE